MNECYFVAVCIILDPGFVVPFLNRLCYFLSFCKNRSGTFFAPSERVLYDE